METYCLIAAQYLPTMGGVENYTFNLAKELIAQGHRAIVITSQKDAYLVNEVDEHGIEIIRVPSLQLLNGRLPVVKPCKQTMTLFNILIKKGVTKMIINTRFYPLSLYAARFAKKHAIPSIVLEHSSAHLSLGGGIVDIAIKIYEHIFCRLVYYNCKNFYGVSQKCVEWLLHYNIMGKGVVYNSIDINTINAIDKNELDLAVYDVPHNAKIVCYAGRMIAEKGVERLHEAFAEVVKKEPLAYLVFAGDGPLLDKLQNTPSKNVVLTGRLSFKQVIALYKQADILCFPTAYPEGFPTCVLEAAACGCFILTTTTSAGATELICSEEYGTLMPDNSPATISKAILKALQDEGTAQKAQMAKKRVEDNFTWRKTAKSLENII